MSNSITIVDLSPDPARIEQVAELLVAGFAENWPEAWPDLPSAIEEVHESLQPGRISRVAIDKNGTAVGWIGGFHEYGLVWELHPLVVHPDRQRQGIGRELVADLEAHIALRGGLTLRLGSDDEQNQTSLSNVDLYPDPLAHLARIRNLRNHPYTFYQKLGFAIIGVMPDASGFGKPDILMAKRIHA